MNTLGEKWTATWGTYFDESDIVKAHKLKAPYSLDKELGSCLIQGSSAVPYQVTLTHCPCRAFTVINKGKKPCKHMLRLAGELGLLADVEQSDQDEAEVQSPQLQRKTPTLYMQAKQRIAELPLPEAYQLFLLLRRVYVYIEHVPITRQALEDKYGPCSFFAYGRDGYIKPKRGGYENEYCMCDSNINTFRNDLSKRIGEIVLQNADNTQVLQYLEELGGGAVAGEVPTPPSAKPTDLQGVIQYLREKGIAVKDNTNAGGALWAIVGQEAAPIMKELGDCGFQFVFLPNGGKSSANLPAWFMRIKGR